jgi:hypothetical protein
LRLILSDPTYDLMLLKTVHTLLERQYFLLFKDYFSHFRMVNFIKNKFEVKNIIEIFIKSVKTETKIDVKKLKTDNRLEFLNYEIISILKKYRIRHQTTVLYR